MSLGKAFLVSLVSCVISAWALPHYKVFVLSGQSNAGGNTEVRYLPPEMNKVHQNIKLFIGEYLVDSIVPNYTLQDNRNFWLNLRPNLAGYNVFSGAELGMGYTLSQLYPNDNIAIIKYHCPGKALYSYFRPPSSGPLTWYPQKSRGYDNLVTTVNSALASIGGTYEVVGMGWLQGESDMLEGKGSEYETHLKNFISDLRTTFRSPNMRFAISQTMPEWGDATQGPLVRNAQQKVADDLRYVGIFDPHTDASLYPYGGMLPNGSMDYHFNKQATVNIGTALAKVLQQVANESATTGIQTTAPFWTFNAGLEGWSGSHSATVLNTAGRMDFAITGGDPYIWSPGNLNFPASVYHYLVGRMQTNTPEVNGELLWSTTDHPSVDGSMQGNLSVKYNDTQLRTYAFDLAYNQKWSGTISQLRLDPTTASTGSVKIDDLKFVGTRSGGFEAIPGVIQAENFNLGGEGNSYHDADVANQGSTYRTSEGVDIAQASDLDGAYSLGWQSTGEWQEYLVQVAKSGSFTLNVRYAASTNTNKIHVEFNGEDRTGSMTLPSTGSVQTFNTFQKVVSLNEGVQMMRVVIEQSTGGFNTNYYQFTPADIGVEFTYPVAQPSFPPNSSIDLSVQVSDPGSQASKVEFYLGSTKIGEDSERPFGISTASLTAGNYRAIAKVVNASGTILATDTQSLYVGNAKVGIRPLPQTASTEASWNCAGCGNWETMTGKYPTLAEKMYAVKDFTGDFKTKKRFFEFYLPTNQDWIDMNPATNSLIQLIRTKESMGEDVEHILICREAELLGVGKWGPIPGDSRILYQRDVDDHHKLFQDAYTAGLVRKNDYKLVQMVREPDVFSTNADAIKIIQSMDGVAYEVHHFGAGEWFYEPELTQRMAKGIQWTIDNGKDYIFYYGPFRWTGCSDYYDDIYKDWLQIAWNSGIPKFSNNMFYYLNAFPFGCGVSRQIGPETDPYSIAGETKWLIEQVSILGSSVTSSSSSSSSSSPSSSATKPIWDFTSSIESWNTTNKLTLSASSSILNATITGGDPYMHSPDNLGFNLADYSTVAFRMRNQSADVTAELFWTTTTATGYDVTKLVQFPIVANDAAQRTYLVDLSAKSTWTGTLKQLRYDPIASQSSGSQAIDWIKLVGGYPSGSKAIPGTIQAEDYNKGGEGVAYHDVDVNNWGGAYRSSEAVDVQGTNDAGAGYNLGWLASGEWTEYLVNVATTGSYDLDLRVAASSNNNTLHVDFNGENKSGTITVNSTGSDQTWTTKTIRVNLTAGRQLMRLAIDQSTGGLNVNWIGFVEDAPTRIKPSQASEPQNIQAERKQFDLIGRWR